MWKLIAWFVSRRPVANWLIERAKRTPYRHITSPDGSDVYMFRWWLFNPYPHDEEGRLKQSWLRRHLPSVRIHHIRRADDARDLHDHPWNARTIVLRGWYMESRLMAAWREMFTRKRGDTHTLKFGEYHRIVSIGTDGAYTLFITGRYRGTWGFRVNGVKVPWRAYLGVKK